MGTPEKQITTNHTECGNVIMKTKTNGSCLKHLKNSTYQKDGSTLSHIQDYALAQDLKTELSHNKNVHQEIIYYGKLKNIKMGLSLKTKLKELCITQETVCLDT